MAEKRTAVHDNAPVEGMPFLIFPRCCLIDLCAWEVQCKTCLAEWPKEASMDAAIAAWNVRTEGGYWIARYFQVKKHDQKFLQDSPKPKALHPAP
ncbi:MULTISPECIES: hypothetical protein [Acidithiobacillus]|uniref:hypothetical protein n=1 Tax=Acidithiobacillus TaxID=119977 RepID=UPI00129E5ACC|nr:MULTISPECIES: hypothetical protein [Acidithiobacillus]MDD2748975.1 hypothetical protein [Acidithiobacillus sp.]MDD5280208.1 hypothetical protein [Acidithiobacillus sp.]